MEPQEAIVRVARKLSNIIFSVMKTGKKYEPYGHKEIKKRPTGNFIKRLLLDTDEPYGFILAKFVAFYLLSEEVN